MDEMKFTWDEEKASANERKQYGREYEKGI
jgi:uncharacterized DUF497 family protein